MELPALPGSSIKPQQVLEHSFEIEDDGTVPLEVFDRLMDCHGIDCTGLSMSSAPRGNRYRNHRLTRVRL